MPNREDADRIEAMQQRLDRVEDEIDEARRDAEKVLPKEPEESFAQTGTVRPEDTDDAMRLGSTFS
ncbi:MAG TPA: hypothetical protein VFA84_12125 [Acidimicrobiales bacterium]|nr:hypothetical protein [Acidimicrobiales bacterium]